MTCTTQHASVSALGEVIEASTFELAVQCHNLYDAPPLGALVKTEGKNPVFGVVAEVTTRGIDPGRRPMVLGTGESSGDVVYDRNPQLSRLLATEFRLVVLGHKTGDIISHVPAEIPPRIHDFVFPCEDGEISKFCESLLFLPMLLAHTVNSPDDLVAALLLQASKVQPDRDDFLLKAGRELATILRGEFIRLQAILRRIDI